MDEKIPTFLVIGGTGTSGFPVVLEFLKNKKYNVQILTRNKSSAIKRVGHRIPNGQTIEFVEGDNFSVGSLQKAIVEGVEGIHINLQGRESKQVENICNVAKTVKSIKKIMFLSQATVCKENSLRAGFIREKYLAEESIKNSGITYTIFKPSWFCNMVVRLMHGNTGMSMGKQPKEVSFVDQDDYVKLVLKSFHNPDTDNKCVFVYGPKKLRLHEAFMVFKKVCLPSLRVKVYSLEMLRRFTKASKVKYLGPAVKYLCYGECDPIIRKKEIKLLKNLILDVMTYFNETEEPKEAGEGELLLRMDTTMEEFCKNFNKDKPKILMDLKKKKKFNHYHLSLLLVIIVFVIILFVMFS